MASSTRSKSDSPEVAIAKLAVRKIQLDQELHKVRDELKKAAREVELPVAVELDDFAVLVKKPYGSPLPAIVIAPLFRR